jgi:hypothetical protein
MCSILGAQNMYGSTKRGSCDLGMQRANKLDLGLTSERPRLVCVAIIFYYTRDKFLAKIQP